MSTSTVSSLESSNDASIDDDKCSFDASEHDTSLYVWLEHPKKLYKGCFWHWTLSLANPNDIMIGYNHLEMDKHWFLWVLKINNLSPTQIFWIQHPQNPMLADGFHVELVAMILNKTIQNQSTKRINTRTYSSDAKESGFINKIKNRINFNADIISAATAHPQWIDKWGTKASIHRYIENPHKMSLFELYDVWNDELSECIGYVCKNKDEIVSVFDRLVKEIGHPHVVVKDCFGVGGLDIFFYGSKQEIVDKFSWKDKYKLFSVEEDLRYESRTGLKVERLDFVGVSFHDNEIIGGAHEQIILKGSLFAGSQSYSNKKVEARVLNIARQVMDKIGTKYVGGFDFAIQFVKNDRAKPKIYLIDMNTGRYTATLPTLMVMQKFGMNWNDTFFMRKMFKIKKHAVFETIVKQYPDLLFDMKSKTGVYFHIFHAEYGKCVVSVFGTNRQNAQQTFKRLRNLDFIIPW